MKQKPVESTAETTPETTIVEEQPSEPVKGNEIVAAPKDEEDSIMDIGSLPTLDDMKELSPEEVHHTPEAVLESAREIGNMIENAEKNPELREKTVKFLLECSEADNVVASIRAVCWKNTMNGVTNWKVFVPVSSAKVPDNIKDLANQLP
jgi:hypothetical protein